MAERDGDNDKLLVAELNQDAVVTDAVPPVAGEVPGQPLAARARIAALADLQLMGINPDDHLRHVPLPSLEPELDGEVGSAPESRAVPSGAMPRHGAPGGQQTDRESDPKQPDGKQPTGAPEPSVAIGHDRGRRRSGEAKDSPVAGV